jgi:hypothetical protein
VPRIRNCTKNLRVSVDHRSVADVLARRSCRYRNLVSTAYELARLGDNAYSFVCSRSDQPPLRSYYVLLALMGQCENLESG